MKSDRRRDEWLQKHGLKVLRVSNGEVLRELEGVMETILKVVEERNRS